MSEGMALLWGDFRSKQETGSVGLKTIWGSGHFMMYAGAACGVFGGLENALDVRRRESG